VDKEANDLVTARLLNWGLWSNVNCYPHLGYTAFVEIMKDYFPQATRINPDDIDGQYIEDILTDLNMGGIKGVGDGQLFRFVCKLEFVEFERPRESKAEHVRRKMKRPCSERTFRYHLYRAKKAIHTFADPIHCKS